MRKNKMPKPTVVEKKKILSAILFVAILLGLSHVMTQEQIAVASQRSALAAYRDFLTSTQTEEMYGATWNLGDVQFAELIDFDNDGIEELVLIISLRELPEHSLANEFEFGLFSTRFVIMGYAGGIRELYHEPIYGEGGDLTVFALASAADGTVYHVDIHNLGDAIINTTYSTLRNGEWVTVLRTLSEKMAERFFVNGVQVNKATYDNAPQANLGIVHKRDKDWHTRNNVQAVLAEINNWLGASPILQATPNISVHLEGEPLVFDVPPQLINGRTMVPMRTIFEALGAQVNWHAASQTATGTRDDTEISLTIGSSSAIVNERTVTIDQPSVVINGRTLVPVRFIAESFGVNVDWDAATRTVTITE